jgi:AraC-like DNA-binding protein
VLSAKASLSPAHFQRTFQALVGETPKNYVARLRLERAAFRLLIHDATLLDIALDCGFQNHETFTRAFRRRFGMPPSSYRAWVRTQAQQRPETAAEQPDDAYSISETKIRRLHRRIWRSFAMSVPMKRCPTPCSTRSKTGPPTKVLLDRASGWASATMPQVRPARSTCDSTQRWSFRQPSLQEALSGTRCSKAGNLP